MSNIFDFLDKCFENPVEKVKETYWKDEDKYHNFIEFLCNYLDKNNKICSDSFYSSNYDCSPYTPEEFEDYCFLLYNAIESYARKNHIPLNIDNYCTTSYEYDDEYYIFNYKNKFYYIECISGQGSFIALKTLDNIKKSQKYIDYSLMIKNKKPSNYNSNLEDIIFKALDEIIGTYSNDSTDKKLIINSIEKYIDKSKKEA